MHKEIIMCAANRYWVKKPDGEEVNIVIADSGHFMPNMQAIIKLLKDLGCELTPDKSDGDRGQGFIRCCRCMDMIVWVQKKRAHRGAQEGFQLQCLFHALE